MVQVKKVPVVGHVAQLSSLMSARRGCLSGFVYCPTLEVLRLLPESEAQRGEAEQGQAWSFFIKETTMRYNPGGGGPCPGHLRDAFSRFLDEEEDLTLVCEALDMGEYVLVRYNEEPKFLKWLLRKLWEYTDTVPEGHCQAFELGGMYAGAVGEIAREL